MDIEKFSSILLGYDKKLKPRVEYFYDWVSKTDNEFNRVERHYKGWEPETRLANTKNIVNSQIDQLEYEPPELKLLIFQLLVIFYPDSNWQKDTVFIKVFGQKYNRLQTYVNHKHPPQQSKINENDLQPLTGKPVFDLNDITTITQGFTEKQQCLIIHLLSEFGRFNLLELDKNITGRAKIISQAINRNQDNVYKRFTDLGIKTEHREIFTYKNLIQIVAVFKSLQLTDIEQYLNDKIDKLKPNF